MSTSRLDRSYVIPLGFAMAVSMWAVAYFCRLPAVMAPSWLLLALMLGVVGFWGWFTGTRTGDGWLAGLMAGAVAAVINMLILGSLLASADDGALLPSAVWWVPGSILVVAAIAGAAAAAAKGVDGDRASAEQWTAVFSKVAVAATFLLIVAGGLVTSTETGLAVVDWPNSFGYNMFLYPLARMTGGIYYEHAHRLFGALIGLTTVVLAFRIWRTDERTWLRKLAAASVVLVIVQGILGGLRVTGGFTLSTSPEDMAPNIVLALTHGVLGQIFLGVMVAIAVVTSGFWRGAPEVQQRFEVKDDLTLQRWLLPVLVLQLVLGAAQRHLAAMLIVHISLAAVVVVMAVMVGVRAWGLYKGNWPVDRLGKGLMILASVQVFFGLAALAVTLGQAQVGAPSALEVTITTTHQATGAIILAVAVALHLWTARLFRPMEGSAS
ncbi:MAG: COX15/CtaA family protein [Holophagae bacterium]|jgi:cytochrome c oxidase assembly protein subunit 15